MRVLIREVQTELAELDKRIASYDRRVRQFFRNSELCQRLGKLRHRPCDRDSLDRGRRLSNLLKNGRQFAAFSCRNNDPVEGEPAKEAQ